MNMKKSKGLWLTNNSKAVYDIQQRKTNAGAGKPELTEEELITIEESDLENILN